MEEKNLHENKIKIKKKEFIMPMQSLRPWARKQMLL